jgi:predicted RNA-binding Zn-ribbon protein involved in translation (DUF1610 family)
MKLFQFMQEYCNAATVIDKLCTHGLLATRIACPTCGEMMHECANNGTDGTMFFCEQTKATTTWSILLNIYSIGRMQMYLRHCVV